MAPKSSSSANPISTPASFPHRSPHMPRSHEPGLPQPLRAIIDHKFPTRLLDRRVVDLSSCRQCMQKECQSANTYHLGHARDAFLQSDLRLFQTERLRALIAHFRLDPAEKDTVGSV